MIPILIPMNVNITNHDFAIILLFLAGLTVYTILLAWLSNEFFKYGEIILFLGILTPLVVGGLILI